MFNKLQNFDRATRARIERVADKARRFGDGGVVAWATRAAEDAIFLGRMRDKDIATLKRLEDTYGHDFYASSGSGQRVTVYA